MARAWAIRCRKAGVFIFFASPAFRMFPHSMNTAGTVDRFRPPRSPRWLNPSLPRYVEKGMPVPAW